MKKILFGILATILLVNFANAQEVKIISGKISSSSAVIDVPEQLKSDQIYKEDSSEFIKYQRYSDEFKTNITLVTDSHGKIVSVVLPKPLTSEVLSRWSTRCLKSLNDFLGCCLGVN